MGLSYLLRQNINDDDRSQKNDAIQKCSDFPPQSCVFDFVNLRASAENVDLNGCILGYSDNCPATNS